MRCPARHSQSLVTIAAVAAAASQWQYLSTSGSGSANVWIALNHFLHHRCRHRRRRRRRHWTGKELPYAGVAERKWSDLMVSQRWSFPPASGRWVLLRFITLFLSVLYTRSTVRKLRFVVCGLQQTEKISCNEFGRCRLLSQSSQCCVVSLCLVCFLLFETSF